MSDALWSTRLRWDSRAGVAKLHGHTTRLTTAPDLGSGGVHACDYVPEVCIAEIQPRACDARRDMTPEEIRAADAVLAATVAATRDAAS